MDLVLRNARVVTDGDLVDIGVRNGRIAAMAPNLGAAASERDAAGRLVFPGFVDCHIHLDKAYILDRCTICEGTLAEAVRETARAKAAFTEEDVYARAARLVEQAILHGTMLLRTFVEVDPRAGLRSLAAIRRIKHDYAFAVDIEICAFAQEGLTQEPETENLLSQALAAGADLVGGCPYTDPDPAEHVRRIFDLAERFGTPVDFHADFDLDPEGSALPHIIAETERRGFGGRVSVGHATKLSALEPNAVEAMARRLAATGIAVTVLPATDLFLTGRDARRLVPRGVAPAHLLRQFGVTATIATNNVLNPFTPFGDASLIRMANLYANVAQLARDDEMDAVFAMVSADAARLMGRAYGLRIGGPADLALLDVASSSAAVRQIAAPIASWKSGRLVMERPAGRIFHP
ncbi:amidohydrolase family protein [Aureimonas phyllosphaerae]|uniref:Cytosine deaminase n=1 Tax=Aureimonas phyllosphaerae TaxID=1166078 RepID=A0A7W6BVY1_9HYPH|nr:amidohydrolase family protein [Aureimonas phyllosphaerae]MBB3937074.1 cytosine deaminase [Aureimonas phyllosphaerae]MBB3960811.1 cytosine deaminase [Aureimonas phyllosphaerae]SFF50014.1 cytosine deaminase [Aureimonas phyllosphaerae]